MTRLITTMLAFVMLASVSTAQTMSPDLTPSLNPDDRCPGYPERPEWTIGEVRDVGFFLRRNLFTYYMRYSVRKSVIEADSCSCELLRPDWDTRREELMGLVPGGVLTKDSRQMSDEQRDFVGDEARRYQREASALLRPYLAICDRDWL